MLNPDNLITTKQFVTMILKSYDNIEDIANDLSSGYVNYALSKGIIDDYDMINIDNPIERRRLARIVHLVLLTKLKEDDQEDWLAAEDLSDLYSCKSCLMHIAQLYVKGIMDGKTVEDKKIFDLKGNISVKEAITVIERTLDKKKRSPRAKGRESKVINISSDEARKLMSDHKAVLIDLRSNEEYQKNNIGGSLNIPLIDISKNPYCLYEYKDRLIILYCQRGSKSLLGANLLIEAGYSNIYNIIH